MKALQESVSIHTLSEDLWRPHHIALLRKRDQVQRPTDPFLVLPNVLLLERDLELRNVPSRSLRSTDPGLQVLRQALQIIDSVSTVLDARLQIGGTVGVDLVSLLLHEIGLHPRQDGLQDLKLSHDAIHLFGDVLDLVPQLLQLHDAEAEFSRQLGDCNRAADNTEHFCHSRRLICAVMKVPLGCLSRDAPPGMLLPPT